MKCKTLFKNSTKNLIANKENCTQNRIYTDVLFHISFTAIESTIDICI